MNIKNIVPQNGGIFKGRYEFIKPNKNIIF